MMLLSLIIRDVHQRCLDMRALDRLVLTTSFSEALKIDPNNLDLHNAISMCNVTFVEVWIKDTLRREIGEYNIRELRNLASKLGIKGYTSLSKDQLLVEIVNHDRKAETTVGRMSSSEVGACTQGS